MSIHEKSALEHIDLKTAAYNVTQEIKGHKDLKSLQNAVEQKRKELASSAKALAQISPYVNGS
jgi:hypothetical protein